MRGMVELIAYRATVIGTPFWTEADESGFFALMLALDATDRESSIYYRGIWMWVHFPKGRRPELQGRIPDPWDEDCWYGYDCSSLRIEKESPVDTHPMIADA